eukprot:Rhum_TRINITY_DN15031_c0_g3::Rhum_TRINITY_DN15031_c0_g3_i2::g.133523::m.133523
MLKSFARLPHKAINHCPRMFKRPIRVTRLPHASPYPALYTRVCNMTCRERTSATKVLGELMKLDRTQWGMLLEEGERNLRDFLRCWYARVGCGFKELIPVLAVSDVAATGEPLSAKVFGRIANTRGDHFLAKELTPVPSTQFCEALVRVLNRMSYTERQKETCESRKRRFSFCVRWRTAMRVASYCIFYLSLPEARRNTQYDIAMYVDASALSYGCAVQFAKDTVALRLHRQWDFDLLPGFDRVAARNAPGGIMPALLELAAVTQALKHAEELYRERAACSSARRTTPTQTPGPRIVIFTDNQVVAALFRQKTLRNTYSSFTDHIKELPEAVDELRRVIDSSCFAQIDVHYIPGQLNPADSDSRNPLSTSTLTFTKKTALRGCGIIRSRDGFVVAPLPDLFLLDEQGNPKPSIPLRNLQKTIVRKP